MIRRIYIHHSAQTALKRFEQQEFDESAIRQRQRRAHLNQIISQLSNKYEQFLCYIDDDKTPSNEVLSEPIDQSIFGNFAVEGNPHGTQKQTSILVGGRSGVQRNMAARDHMTGIPENKRIRRHSRIRAKSEQLTYQSSPQSQGKVPHSQD